MPFNFNRPQRNSLPVLNGPFSAPGETTFGQNQSFSGADAALERGARELALKEFGTAMEQSRQAAEPSYLQSQRRNIQSHGTIEMPQDFNRRMGMQTAADTVDPASPLRRAGDLEHGRKMESVYQSNVRPTEIAGQTQRDIETSRAGTARYGVDQNVAADRYGSDMSAGADEYGSEVAATERFLSSLPESVFRNPQALERAIRAFGEAMKQSQGGF